MATALSLARGYFELIRSQQVPVTHLRSLTNSPIPVDELDWREFKAKPDDEGEFKRLWSKVLAGFANNQGGVLVWGLDGRKNKDGIDCVCKECPVADPHVVKSRLVELQRDATDPPLANVEYEVYPVPEDPAKGLIVCFVPEGPHKPYRANLCPGKPYYTRAGDNFTILSTSQLRSMFYPRHQALFEVEAVVSWELKKVRDGSAPLATFRCTMTIRNRGTATAKDVYVHFANDQARVQHLGMQFDDATWWVRGRDDGGADCRILKSLHPGMGLLPLTQQWDGPTRVVQQMNGDRDLPKLERFTLSLTFYTDNQEPQRATLDFDIEPMAMGAQNYCALAVVATSLV